MKRPASSRKAVPDKATCIYGAGVLLNHLDALEQEVRGVSAGEPDIEYVHRARVASRRLRAALPLFTACLPEKKGKVWLKQIRDITRALGTARDLDVQIENVNAFAAALEDPKSRPGMLRLRLRLTQQRAQVQPVVMAAVQKLDADQTIQAMREHLNKLNAQKDQVYLYTPGLYRHSFEAIQGRLQEFLAYRSIIFDPEKVTELHEMRIAAKRLRYTMETFAPLYSSQLKPHLKAVRKIQEMLGDIHDCDLWQQLGEEFLSEERERIRAYFGHQRPFARLVRGIRAFEQDRRLAREAVYQEFIRAWQQWEDEDIWGDLLRTIQVPFPRPDTIFPPLNQSEPPDPDPSG